MKKLLVYLVVASLTLGVNFGTVQAHEEIVLPGAGLTPENPFYFLDRLGEFIQELFTFGAEGEARLQIKFAGERISEIKVILETKGVEAKGLDVAEFRLIAHVAKAATVIEEEMAEGKDVSALAKEIHDDFHAQKEALEQAFEEQEEILEAQEDELKRQIREALRAGDTALVESLTQELGQVKAELELLEIEKEEQEEALEAEEERLEEALDAEEKAQDAIDDVKEELAEVQEEAEEEGVLLPTNAFAEFNSLLAQAENAFEAGDFEEAERLAELAEDSLEIVEELIEELEEEGDDEEDADDNDEDENNTDEENINDDEDGNEGDEDDNATSSEDGNGMDNGDLLTPTST